MELWNWITGLSDHGGVADISPPPHTEINPATGLPMIGGIGGVDDAGNPFGHDLHRWHETPTTGASWAGDTIRSSRIGSTGSDAWSKTSWSDWDR